LAVFDFVEKHAESQELVWALRQFQPQLLLILTRARGAQALKAEDYGLAIHVVEEGLERIRAFYRETSAAEAADQSGEVLSLQDWLEEIRGRRPLSRREQLERALHEAVKSEDYERAAQVRDELKNLKSD
jgi:hypothetical protein